MVTDTGSSTGTAALQCEMCQNYETNITILQDTNRRLSSDLQSSRQTCTRLETEIAKEKSHRSELEQKMVELQSAIQAKTQDVSLHHAQLQRRVDEVVQQHLNSLDDVRKSLSQKEACVETLKSELNDISAKYLKLLGAHRKAALEMQAEDIDLPQEADQLQFMCLQMREELIETKAAKSHMEQSLADEITILKEQLTQGKIECENMERRLVAQLNQAQTDLGIATSKLSTVDIAFGEKERNERQIRDLQLQHTIDELEAQVAQVQNERAAIEVTAQNYKARCVSLQHELETSEIVQRDFVKLSQNLQIQLEKIRQCDQEVRWQFEEDVDSCTGCASVFSKGKPKPHCLHCGKIFCSSCLRATVKAGQSGREAPVCQVCHTLLNRDSMPFFATQEQG